MDSEKLAGKSCVPCLGGVPPLGEAAARELQRQTPLWSLEANALRLKRTLELADFQSAMKFVNRVAEVAEAEGHHPDIAIHWNRVELTLWTHKIGGLHENDFILAAKIDALLAEPSRPTGDLAG